MASKEDTASRSKNTKRRKRDNGFEEWGGYMEAKKSKLAAQFQGRKPIELQNVHESEIFKGVAIFVNGYTNPPAEELKKLMVVHGGTYHYYYSHSRTTHIIASNLPNSKIKKLKKEIVVTAQWITDSIKAGKLLPSHDYLLYSPEAKDKQQKLCFDKFQAESKLQSDRNYVNPNLMTETDFNISTETLLNKNDSGDSENFFACFESTELPLESNVKEKNEIHSKLPNVNTKFPNATSNSATNSSIGLHKQEPAFKAGHPEFLSEFYSHSRLHHISTAGQELKRYVQYLGDHTKDFPGREKLKVLFEKNDFSSHKGTASQESLDFKADCNSNKVIMHLDMDCFFVSVGLRKHPELKGYPVAVTHSKGKRGGPQEGSDIHYEASYYANKSEKKIKGLIATDEGDDFVETKPKISINSKEYGSLSEIASCNYEARRSGLRNGMFLGEALRRCPNLKTIPYDFESYNEVSKQLYDIVSSYTMEIEAVSVDELYIDCTELLNDTGISSLQFASILRTEIFEKTKCTASAGIGPNMLLSRLATKVAKPNGQYHVLDIEIEEFMKKQKANDLPGVGYKISKRLLQLSIESCADLQSISLPKLQQEFGPKLGESLFRKCRGKDSRTVQLQKDRKSVSAEINYGIRFETNEDVNNFIRELAVEVHNRLQHINCKGKSLTLKLMVRRPDAPTETAKFMGHGVCDNMSKSLVLKSATDSSELIGHECCMLAQSLKIKPQDYRGVGIQMSKLEHVQKEKATHKTLETFFCHDNACTSKPETFVQNDTVSPKILKPVAKSTPEKSTIKHFLSKPQRKLTYDLADYVPDQLDQSVLNALPEDLRKEVLENCGKPTTSRVMRPRKCSPSKSSPTTPVSSTRLIQKKHSDACNRTELINSLILKSNSVSSVSFSSNENATRADSLNNNCLTPQSSPVPSVSSSSNENTLKTELLIDTCLAVKSNPVSSSVSSNENTAKNESLTNNFLLKTGTSSIKSGKTESHKKRVIEFYVTWGENENKSLSKPVKKASLGGASELDDVRKLLKEWIANTQAPLEEDIEELKQFLLDSIEEDLSKVSLILKYFYRLASSHSLLWKEAYLSILSYVQQKMLQNFGAMLAASSDFPT